MSKPNYTTLAKAVLQTEADSILQLIDRINDDFHHACEIVLNCEGRVVVTGMGKSGHIGNKIAATLASTGTPSFFMHPGEASHGDLGMITAKDSVIALSNSGETNEISAILPLLIRLEIPVISLTGNPESSLAKAATVNLDTSVEKEACPLGLAPTSSTTASLAMGDALAIAVLDAKGFTEADFALSHPGGSLGRKLLIRVEDIMHKGDEIPVVNEQASLTDALLEMSNKGLGITAINNHQNKLCGIFTDGDLRRTLATKIDIHQAKIEDCMTKNCVTIAQQKIASEVLSVMQDKKINALIVVDSDQVIVGALNMHDLLRAGIV